MSGEAEFMLNLADMRVFRWRKSSYQNRPLKLDCVNFRAKMFILPPFKRKSLFLRDIRVTTY